MNYRHFCQQARRSMQVVSGRTVKIGTLLPTQMSSDRTVKTSTVPITLASSGRATKISVLFRAQASSGRAVKISEQPLAQRATPLKRITEPDVPMSGRSTMADNKQLSQQQC